MFKVTLAQAIHHNHRMDSCYDGRYVLRLPDLTLVYAEDYARCLAEREANQSAGGRSRGERAPTVPEHSARLRPVADAV